MIKSDGNVKKLMQSRKERFGVVDPTIEEAEALSVRKNLAKVREISTDDP